MSLIMIHLTKKAQIALMLAKKIKISTKCSNFLDIFLEKKALVLLKITKLNQHSIKLQEDKQPPYRPIYSLELVEFKTLKIYI